MDKMKVLNISEINLLLDQGNILRYATVYGRVYMQDTEWNTLGAVRFDTYLKLLRENKIKQIRGTTTDDLYVKVVH